MRPLPSRAALLAAASALALNASAAQAQVYDAASWNGLYLGLHGGQDLSNLSNNFGALGLGIHAGYGLQLGSVVLGVEADAERGASVDSEVLSTTLYWNNQTNWTGSLRGRIGWAFDTLQVYGTAGAAYRNATTTLNRFGSITSSTASTPGLVYGVGFDYRILPKIDVRLDALRFDYSNAAMDWIANPSGLPASLTDAQHDTVVRAGVSFRLN
jgi:outer membrane immunogenic protein